MQIPGKNDLMIQLALTHHFLEVLTNRPITNHLQRGKRKAPEGWLDQIDQLKEQPAARNKSASPSHLRWATLCEALDESAWYQSGWAQSLPAESSPPKPDRLPENGRRTRSGRIGYKTARHSGEPSPPGEPSCDGPTLNKRIHTRRRGYDACQSAEPDRHGQHATPASQCQRG